jgi:hypothetical protein
MLETWSFTQRGKHVLRMDENKVLKNVCELRKKELTEWRKLHNENPHNLYHIVFLGG